MTPRLFPLPLLLSACCLAVSPLQAQPRAGATASSASAPAPVAPAASEPVISERVRREADHPYYWIRRNAQLASQRYVARVAAARAEAARNAAAALDPAALPPTAAGQAGPAAVTTLPR